MLDLDRVNEILTVNHDGSVFHKKPGHKLDGVKVGSSHHSGYIVHTIDGHQYGLHRIVFLSFHGYLPVMVDHYDQDKSNNSIKVDGKQISIGSFVDKCDAVVARKEAEVNYGFCFNHGGSNGLS